MTYLFLGQDLTAKDSKIAEIKKKICPSPDALKFDCETLYAQKLDPEELKKAFITLPAIANERIVIIRECHKLSAHNKELIFEFVKNPGRCVLALESEKMETTDAFIKKLGSAVKVFHFRKETPLNVFNLTDAVSLRRSVEALKILSVLLSQGDQPLQIMGGLVWYWKKARAGFSMPEFKKGLLALQEADLNIKRSRLRPDHALEILIVKLCSSEAG